MDGTMHPAIEFELARAGDDGVDLTPCTGFTARQLREIRLALRTWGTATFLTERPLDYLQMELLRTAKLEGFSLKSLTDGEFDCNQMWEILLGLRSGVDTGRYADPAYSHLQMRQIRIGLEEGLETSGYEDASLSAVQMMEKRARAPRRPFRTRLALAARILLGPKRRFARISLRKRKEDG